MVLIHYLCEYNITKKWKTMKKYFFLLFIGICMVFTISCNRTDGNIVGTWVSVSDNDDVGILLSGETKLVINDDGTFLENHIGYANGEKIPNLTMKGTWKIENGNLILTEPGSNTETGEPFVLSQKIRKLTSTKLTLDNFEYKRLR